MKARPRLRRLLKWGGLAICLLLAAAWAVSVPFDVVYRSKGYYVVVELVAGQACVTHWPVNPRPGQGRKVLEVQKRPTWQCDWHSAWGTGKSGAFSYSWMNIPLGMPLLLVGIPTMLVFWRDRRRIPPGHCQACGYDLTGNTSGVCPECGVQI
jgi:hypothetical protein